MRVGLAGRRVGGWVVAVGPPDPDVPAAKLRPLAKVTGHGPSAELIDLAAWASRRWAAGRLRPFLLAASPPRAVPALPGPGGDGRPARAGGCRRGPPAGRRREGSCAGRRARTRSPSSWPRPRSVRPWSCTPSVDQARLLGARLRRAGLSVALVPRDWAAAAGGVDVVVGARATAWAPMRSCGAVVVLDEHDEALQEERAPTWHAHDVAVERARRAGVPCLLVSPVPPSVHWSGPADRVLDSVPQRGAGGLAHPRGRRPPTRRAVATLAGLQPADQGAARPRPDRGVRPRRAGPGPPAGLPLVPGAAALRALPGRGGPDRDGLLRCARCGTERPVVCQVCGSSALVVLRPGVSGLREELEAAAGRPVVEITGETAEEAAGSAAAVFVGTEAVLHRVPRADVVAFLDLDDELLAPRFRADEQALVLLARAARLLGPRADGGRLLVQTRLPHHEVLDAVLHADPGRLCGPALARRRELGLPPARALAVLSGAGAEELAGALRMDPTVTVAGPADGRYLVRGPTPTRSARRSPRRPDPPAASTSRSTLPACEVVVAAGDLTSVLVRKVHTRGAVR